MKKIKYISLLGLAGALTLTVALTSCSSGTSKKDVYGLTKDGEVQKLGECELLFKDNSTIPYISLEEGVKYMSLIRSANLDDLKYKVEVKKENDNYVISNEAGASCTLNKEKQTLTYNDYDKFVSVVPDSQQPLSLMAIKSDARALKVVSNDYTPGKSIEINLNDYSKLDIYEKNDKYYLPLSVYNSVLLNTGENMNLSYNGKNVFLMAGSALTDNSLGIPFETKLGEKFHEGAAQKEISDEYLEYYYQSLCFDFNNEYGLTEKFESFDTFLTNFKKDLLSSKDPKKIDKYTAIALTWLGDGHTALTNFSNLYGFGENDILDQEYKEKVEPISDNLEKLQESFNKDKKAKIKAGSIKEGLEYKNDTVFVTFDQFTNIDEDSLYNETFDNTADLDDFTGLDDIPGLDFGTDIFSSGTANLFNKLYKDLTTDTEKKANIKNIVVDLTSNQGGAADGLLYSLSTLIGNVTVDMIDQKTGGHNKQVFKADMNGDKKINDGDKSLIDQGFNVYFLDSQYSFSSANAMPVLAKLNSSKVKTLGAKTAGGPCAVRTNVTPIGNVIASSSLYTISKQENGKYVNIDGGVEADHVLDEEKMLDRNYIVTNINTWK